MFFLALLKVIWLIFSRCLKSKSIFLYFFIFFRDLNSNWPIPRSQLIPRVQTPTNRHWECGFGVTQTFGLNVGVQQKRTILQCFDMSCFFFHVFPTKYVYFRYGQLVLKFSTRKRNDPHIEKTNKSVLNSLFLLSCIGFAVGVKNIFKSGMQDGASSLSSSVPQFLKPQIFKGFKRRWFEATRDPLPPRECRSDPGLMEREREDATGREL